MLKKQLTIGQRLATIPVLFVLGAGCLLGLMSWQASQSNKSAASINLAGRQRMLNQRFTREVIEVAGGVDADFNGTRTLLADSLIYLRDGGDHEFGLITKAEDQELLSLLQKQSDAIEAQAEIANRFLTSAQNPSQATKSLQKQLVDQTAKTHAVAHGAVKQLASIADQNRSSAMTYSYIAGFFIVLISGGWAWRCGRVVTKQIQDSACQVQRLSDGKLNAVSLRLKGEAESTSDQATMASGAAEQVTANVKSLALVVEQFERSIKDIAENASNAASVAEQAVEAAGETNTTISRLDDSTSEIGNVIKAINSIAEQTNLLALNATIEAARAGEAGKGFAVVANEVKELAKETSKATEEIVGRIETIRSDTHDAVDAIGQVSNIISEINVNQGAISTAVDEQSSMTSEISRNISEVATGSGEIAQSVARVAEAAQSATIGSDETIETAKDIESYASNLLQLVGSGDQCPV